MIMARSMAEFIISGDDVDEAEDYEDGDDNNDSITEDEGDEDSDSYDDELHESKLVASK